VDLYRILEVVLGDVGGQDALATKGWTSLANIKSFKHTANSVGASGDMARHGTEQAQPPKQPMLLGEAKARVLFIVQAWLQEKRIQAPEVAAPAYSIQKERCEYSCE
jgi:hypothetical protein